MFQIRGLPEISSQSDTGPEKVALSGIGFEEKNSFSSPDSSRRYKIGTKNSHSSIQRFLRNFVVIGAQKLKNCDKILHNCVDLHCFIVRNSHSLIMEHLYNNRSVPKYFSCRDSGIPIISSHSDSKFQEKHFYGRVLKQLMSNGHHTAF